MGQGQLPFHHNQVAFYETAFYFEFFVILVAHFHLNPIGGTVTALEVFDRKNQVTVLPG